MTERKIAHLLTALAVASLAACGGGGGSTQPVVNTTPLTGTAAVGTPLANATVTLKDANGKTLSTTAGADGSYTFADVSGLTAPLMLETVGMAGGTTYSLHSVLTTVPAAGVSGVLNTTPATEAITAQALGADPATAFKDASAIKAADATKLADAKARLNAALKEVLTALGLDSSKVDLFTTAFVANDAGLDKLLDLVSISSDSTQTVQVTNKATAASVTIAPNAPPDTITPVVPPTQADLALNTATIKDLFTSFNALSGTADNINSSAMLDLVDASFLDSGKTRTNLIANIVQHGIGMKISAYVLGGCDSAAKICEGQATNTKADGSVEVFTLAVKQGSDGKWRVYGNQSPFEFDLKPVAYQQNHVGTNAPASTVQTGFNFWLNPYVNTSNTSTLTYQSAIQYSSRDNGATWTESMRVKANSNCAGDFLSIDDGSGDCGNFKTIPDSSVAINNAALAAGTKWFKIVAYPNADYSGTPATYQHRSTRPQFTNAAGAAAVAASGLGINTSELGTGSVSFFGNPDSVNINIQPVGSTYAMNWAFWDNPTDIASLNGKATLAAALKQCGSACTDAYGTGAKITFIQMSNRDSLGRGIWVNWQLWQ